MKALYIIPARGGSKGIPHKNIKPLAGKPLIMYSIDVARALAADTDICVSTDDEAIARVATEAGLEVPFLRPAHLSTDTAGSREVMLHAVEYYRSIGREYDTIVLLQPTSPLRTAEDVRGCIELYNDQIDMVVSVKPAASNPYYNCFETDSDGFLHISKGDGLYTRRQDAPKAWEFNGAVYVINIESLKAMPMGKFARRVMYETPTERSIDLDTPADWAIAEYLINNR